MSSNIFDRLNRVEPGDQVGTRRLGSHLPPNPNQSRVKRALFGPVDHEENKQFFKREFDRSLNEKKKEYNFDFETEQALDGRWEWTKIVPHGQGLQVSPLLSLEVEANVSELQDKQKESQEISKVPVFLEAASKTTKEAASEPSLEALVKVCDKSPVSKGQTSNTYSQSHQRKSRMSGNLLQLKLPFKSLISFFLCRFFPSMQTF